MIAQTLLVLKLTDSGIALGILTACQFLPVLLLGAVGRHRRRPGRQAPAADHRSRPWRWCSRSPSPSIVFSGHATVGVIYVLAAVQGVITAFDNPLPPVVRRRDGAAGRGHERRQPQQRRHDRLPGASVPALAGVLVITVGFGWAFLLDAISYLAVIAGLLAMRTSELYTPPPTPKAKGQVRDGLRYIRSERQLFVPLVMMAIVGTLAFNFSVTIPLLVTGPLGGSDGTFTMIFSVLSLGSLVGALWTARRDEVTSRQLVRRRPASASPCSPWRPRRAWRSCSRPASWSGCRSIAFMTSSTAIVQVLAAPAYRGRVLAIQSMVFLGSTPIGGPIVGWVADLAGPRASLAVGAVGCLAAAAYGARASTSPPRRAPDRRPRGRLDLLRRLTAATADVRARRLSVDPESS